MTRSVEEPCKKSRTVNTISVRCSINDRLRRRQQLEAFLASYFSFRTSDAKRSLETVKGAADCPPEGYKKDQMRCHGG